MTPTDFVSALESAILPHVFNPWRDRCEVHDLEDAAARRRENLRLVLDHALEGGVTTMWIGRDLGYRGGRRTGVPLTDEVHLASAGALFNDAILLRATHGPIVAERTAAVVCRVLEQVRQPVILWNVFPFHPHEAGEPMSNRCHTRAERQAAWPLLEALIDMIRPERMVAIGRDASHALTDLGIDAHAVRHPSYGGQSEFIAGMRTLYGLSETPPLFAAAGCA